MGPSQSHLYVKHCQSNVCDLYTGDSKEKAIFDGFGSFSTLPNPFYVTSAPMFDATNSLAFGTSSTALFGASNTEPCTVSHTYSRFLFALDDSCFMKY